MSLRIEYHELVDNDLEHAWTWYEDHERGLGDRFLDAIHAAVLRASRWPNAGSPVLRDDDDDDEIIERKLPAHGFPYAVRYRMVDDRLIVMAVLHQHRHPDSGADREPWPSSTSPRAGRLGFTMHTYQHLPAAHDRRRRRRFATLVATASRQTSTGQFAARPSSPLAGSGAGRRRR